MTTSTPSPFHFTLKYTLKGPRSTRDVIAARNEVALLGGRWFRRWCCSGSHPRTPPGNLIRLHCFLPPPSPGARAPWKRQATHGTTPVTPARLLLLGYPLGSLCPSPCHIPLSHRSSCVGWGGRKGMVLEEETAHWRWERGGCATGHIVQISRRINVVHGGYVILHCQ